MPMDEETRQELLQITDDLADLRRRQHEGSRRLSQLQDEMGLIRAQALLDIAQEKDESGKPRYSNQKVRDAELTLRLHKNPQYRMLSTEYSELLDDHQAIYIESSRLQERRVFLMADRDFGL
jgi:hypothetical protein